MIVLFLLYAIILKVLFEAEVFCISPRLFFDGSSSLTLFFCNLVFLAPLHFSARPVVHHLLIFSCRLVLSLYSLQSFLSFSL